jgi:glycolate oxidase
MPSPLVSDLREALGRKNVLSAPSELTVYDCDALTIERHRPDAVAFPRATREVADTVSVCRRHGAAIVARGAGTSLAGGCLPTVPSPFGRGARGEGCPASDVRLGDGNAAACVVVALTRMNRILEIDLRNRMAVVEPGVVNLRLTEALADSGYHFAPDPSSQTVSTIGGNLATNAGGPHTLKYGVTANHVLGLEAVLADSSIVQLGPVENPGLLDLVGVLTGSEGTLAIVTKIWVRLTPNPQDNRTIRAIFNSPDDACSAASGIIAAGLIPAAMELMDGGSLAAVEEAFHFGFPPDAGAVLIVEVDGPAVELDAQRDRVVELCRQFGAREVLQAASAEQRELLWKCRKSIGGAIGRVSPSSMTMDGVIPRTKLPAAIRRTTEIGRKYNLRVLNVAHAGDGNLHPFVLFDEREPEQVRRAMAANREILEECMAAGGSITAEHGIGIEKLAFMSQQFSAADLEAMRRVRRAFDPVGIFNPGKTIPA